MVPVAVDELVASLEDGVGLVDGVVLVVEAVLADQDDVEAEILKAAQVRAQSQLAG